ncbi:MAG: alpha/beta hydrolase [Terracidiphilus sp.]|nr:alpha/beta hydrolase [Terracidiphilus sp.]
MSHAADTPTVSLSYSDLGSGLPVVFLHPTPLDREYWRPVAWLLPGIRAILVDLRGHGQSPLGDGLPAGAFTPVPDAPVLSMAQYATDVLALLDCLGLDKAVFAGCSVGGSVLLEIWRRAPGRVRGLAFVCSKPQSDASDPVKNQRRAATIAQARSGGLSAICDGMAHGLIGATAQRQRPAIYNELRARMTVTPEAMVAIQAGLGTRPDSMATVSTITVPVLAIAGGEDPGISPAEMQAFQAAPGGCAFYELSHAGHLAAYEDPEAVAAFFRDWLVQFHV